MDSRLTGRKIEWEGPLQIYASHCRSNVSLEVFKGRMVVRSGGVAGGFRNTDEKDTSAESADSGVALFHVRGTDDVNTRAVQGEFLFTFPHLYLYLRTGD